MEKYPLSKDQNPFLRDNDKRNLRKASKTNKRQRDPKPPRQRNWLVLGDELETLPPERIMPRDETDRRRLVQAAALRPEPAPNTTQEAGILGRVIEVSSGLCRVRLATGVVMCRLRGALTAYETGYTNIVAVGDRVSVTDDGQGEFVVESVLPRQNALTRPNVFVPARQQVIAANVDQLLIVAAWRQPSLWTELVDRYLIAAARDDLPVLLCINKVDLAESEAALNRVVAIYRPLVEALFLTSVPTGMGIAGLATALHGKTSVLAGLSGVGKSSLLTAIQPDFMLKTGAISEKQQGQHTTTQALMLPFGADGYVIDTPGIREFGLGGLTQRELAGFYPEFAPYADHCRFRNCTHTQERGCAVRIAFADGEISADRYENYCKIYQSLPE